MRTVLFFLITLFFLTSCEESTTRKMTANIDGVTWTAATRVTVEQGDNFIITGTSLTGATLVLTIFGNTEGTYDLTLESTDLDTECIAVYKTSISTTNEDTWYSEEGYVDLNNINRSDNTISGEFYFTMKKGLLKTEDMSITGGTFSNLKYTSTSLD